MQWFAVIRVTLKIRVPVEVSGQDISHDELENLSDSLHDRIRDFYDDPEHKPCGDGRLDDTFSEIERFEDDTK